MHKNIFQKKWTQLEAKRIVKEILNSPKYSTLAPEHLKSLNYGNEMTNTESGRTEKSPPAPNRNLTASVHQWGFTIRRTVFDIPVTAYVTENEKNLPAVVYFHGGA